ncbi:MAG: VTT domain-containing protein [Bacilli bacterium]|nr:VTT domain-containing protein [Bacilli bacterium]
MYNTNMLEEIKKKLQDKEVRKKLIGILIVVVIFVGITIACLPYLRTLASEEGRANFKAWLDQFGFWGYAIMTFIMVLQVVIAFIPGEPLEVLCGILYGTWGGALICMLGSLIGSAIVFLIVRKLGKNDIDRLLNSPKIDQYKFLKYMKDPSKRDTTIFVLFFIIGTPKDVLTYFVPFTGISLLRFLGIILIAKIPAIITSTMAGNSLSEGRIWKSVIIFAIAAVLGIGGILLNNYITKKHAKDNPQ